MPCPSKGRATSRLDITVYRLQVVEIIRFAGDIAATATTGCSCSTPVGNLPATCRQCRSSASITCCTCMPLCASANPAVRIAQQREGQRQQATSSARRRCDHSPNGRQRYNHEPQKYAQQHVHSRANNGLHEINRQH